MIHKKFLPVGSKALQSTCLLLFHCSLQGRYDSHASWKSSFPPLHKESQRRVCGSRKMLLSTAFSYVAFLSVITLGFRSAHPAAPEGTLPKPPWPMKQGQKPPVLPTWATREVHRISTRLRGSTPPAHQVAGKSMLLYPYVAFET
jgi:hypothetical protein